MIHSPPPEKVYKCTNQINEVKKTNTFNRYNLILKYIV